MSSLSSSSSGTTYCQSGVNIEAGEAFVEAIRPLVTTTDRPGNMGSLGGFGALFDLKSAGFTDPILVSCTDGVGTKLTIAIETNSHKTIGIDLVAMCVNDLVVQGAEPLFFLDYFATGHLSLDVATHIVKGIAEGCKRLVYTKMIIMISLDSLLVPLNATLFYRQVLLWETHL